MNDTCEHFKSIDKIHRFHCSSGTMCPNVKFPSSGNDMIAENKLYFNKRLKIIDKLMIRKNGIFFCYQIYIVIVSGNSNKQNIVKLKITIWNICFCMMSLYWSIGNTKFTSVAYKMLVSILNSRQQYNKIHAHNCCISRMTQYQSTEIKNLTVAENLLEISNVNM